MCVKALGYVYTSENVQLVSVCTHVQCAWMRMFPWLGGVESLHTSQGSLFGSSFSPLNFLKSFFVFPHYFLVYQKGIGPWSRNLAIVSEPTDSFPLPPALASSCGRPWRPAAWPSSTAWSAGLEACLAPVCCPPATAFPFKALHWLLSHHFLIDSTQHPRTPPEVLLLFPIYRQGNKVTERKWLSQIYPAS